MFIISEVCLYSAKKFISELSLYSAKELHDHDKFGEVVDEGANVLKPHVSCPFCLLKVFDQEALRDHLNKTYFSCSYCKSKQAIYYKDIESIVKP